MCQLSSNSFLCFLLPSTFRLNIKKSFFFLPWLPHRYWRSNVDRKGETAHIMSKESKAFHLAFYRPQCAPVPFICTQLKTDETLLKNKISITCNEMILIQFVLHVFLPFVCCSIWLYCRTLYKYITQNNGFDRVKVTDLMQHDTLRFSIKSLEILYKDTTQVLIVASTATDNWKTMFHREKWKLVFSFSSRRSPHSA